MKKSEERLLTHIKRNNIRIMGMSEEKKTRYI